MNSGQRCVPVAKIFSEGFFYVNELTYCVTIDPNSRGWCKNPDGNLRRSFRSGKARKMYAVEVVARSLMEYDAEHGTRDNLVTRMAFQYNIMNYGKDLGRTLDLMQKAYNDPLLPLRAVQRCDACSECHNPFHRLLQPARIKTRAVYARFRDAVAKTPSILNAADTHVRLGVSAEAIKLCKDLWFKEIEEIEGFL